MHSHHCLVVRHALGRAIRFLSTTNPSPIVVRRTRRSLLTCATLLPTLSTPLSAAIRRVKPRIVTTTTPQNCNRGIQKVTGNVRAKVIANIQKTNGKKTGESSAVSHSAGHGASDIGARDNAIKSPMVNVLDERGVMKGLYPVKHYLAKMNRLEHCLVVTKKPKTGPPPPRNKDGPGLPHGVYNARYPEASVLCRAEVLRRERDAQEAGWKQRKFEAKEKIYKISMKCSVADVRHKMQAAVDALEKGDNVRVQLYQKKAKNQLEATAIGKTLVDFVRGQLETAGKAGIGKKAPNQLEFHYTPRLSKKRLLEQKEKEAAAAVAQESPTTKAAEKLPAADL